jgi:hypothetical protein
VTPRGGTVFETGDHVYLISSSSETVSVPASFRARARPAPVVAEATNTRAERGVDDAPEAGEAQREP